MPACLWYLALVFGLDRDQILHKVSARSHCVMRAVPTNIWKSSAGIIIIHSRGFEFALPACSYSFFVLRWGCAQLHQNLFKRNLSSPLGRGFRVLSCLPGVTGGLKKKHKYRRRAWHVLAHSYMQLPHGKQTRNTFVFLSLFSSPRPPPPGSSVSLFLP